MSRSLAVLISHQLGKPEAIRRKSGLAGVQQNLSGLLAALPAPEHECVFVLFGYALGQVASGTIDVNDDHVRLDVMPSLADGSAGRQDTAGDPRTGEEGPERARASASS